MIIALVHFLSPIIIVIILCHYLLYIFIYIYSDAMQSEDAKFLKRKVKSGSIDVHPTEKALIVNYELEALILGQYGNPMHGNKKACQKVIRLHTLNSKTDCAALAKEVISKCNLIHSSKLAEVEQLIFYLKKRSEGSSVSTRSSSQNSDSMSPVENMQSAILNCIDDYVELLYDDIPEKIRGSALILQLARNPDNLIELAKNEALLSALSRVLREEWKRSIELSTNIVYTFFCFSTYNEFHSVIIQYKIGSLCMDVIDYELKRYDHWKERVDNKKKPLTPDKGEPPRSRIPEPKRRPKSGTWAVADVNGTKNWSVCSSYHEDLCNASDDSLVKNDDEMIKRKLKTLAKRQEQLLRVAFYLLLNIADNVKVEEKMHKKDIVGLLIGALRRHSNIDLLILIVSFLQKLSTYRENKNSMATHNIVEVISTLLDTNNADLTNVALKLLFNLTFDTKLRNKIIKVGLLPKLITFTSDDKHMNIVMKVLYHLSMDDRVKVMFTQSDCVKLLTDMLLLNVSSEISMISSTSSAPPELLALCVNLAACRRAAAQMVGEGRLREIVARAFRHANVTLMKLVRNLSQHQENQAMFIEFVGDVAGAITSGDAAEDFVIECLGVLSNILNPEIDILAVAKRYNLIPFIIRLLQPDSGYPPDLVLEGVVCAGALAADESCAVSICTEGGTAALVSLLRVRQSDDEHVLQTAYAFRQMLAHNTAAEFLVNETEAPAYLIDLMQDKNPEIRKLCDSCLDIISQMQSDWAGRIKVERFRCHNGQWLSVIEGLGSADAGDYNTDMDLPPYLSTDYLTSHNLFPSDSQTSLNNETDSLSGEIDINGSRPLSRYNYENEDCDFALMNSSDIMSATSFDNESVLSSDFALHK